MKNNKVLTSLININILSNVINKAVLIIFINN
jgi:hypothetical protein